MLGITGSLKLVVLRRLRFNVFRVLKQLLNHNEPTFKVRYSVVTQLGANGNQDARSISHPCQIGNFSTRSTTVFYHGPSNEQPIPLS